VSACLTEIGVRSAKVIEYLGLAQAVTQIAIQVQPVGQCILSCREII
jgi:hypothetical protein